MLSYHTNYGNELTTCTIHSLGMWHPIVRSKLNYKYLFTPSTQLYY